MAVKSENRHEALYGRHLGDRRPLIEGLVVRNSLAQAQENAVQVPAECAPAPFGQSVERRSETEPGAEQHGQLFGGNRKFEFDTTLPGLGPARQVLFYE